MILIVGLGNFEQKYQNNRHNIGFHFIDFLIKKYNFIEDQKLQNKTNSIIYKAQSADLLLNLQRSFNEAQLSKNKKDRLSFKFPDEDHFVLLKPKTFMNLSGNAVASFLKNYTQPSLTIVAFDDIETQIGGIKFAIKTNGTGGHNGIRSIKEKTSIDFMSLKIGIDNNFKKNNTTTANTDSSCQKFNCLADFVLSDFTKTELQIIKEKFATLF
jgi:PTH1 family peptidyl-tRNA hydrolase